MEQARNNIVKLKKSLEDAEGNLNSIVESYANSVAPIVRFKNPRL